MECDPTRMCERLVGLGDVEVLGVDDEAGSPLRVHVRGRAQRPRCGGCGGPLWSDGERPVVLVDLPAFGRPARLVWHKRRWRCGSSGCSAGTVTEQDLEIAPPREKLTTRAGRWATRQSGLGRPLGEVAEELGCSWHPVNASVSRWGEALLAADTERISQTAALGLDEHLMWRRGRFGTKSWATGIVDVGRGQLLDIVPARTANAPARWLLERPCRWLAGVRWVVLDLSGPYRAAFDAAVPHAKQVADPFCVVRLANDALDEVRRRVQNQTLGHRGRKHDPLYRARKLLVSASERVTDAGRARLRGLLDAGDPYGEVRDAWHAKETLRSIYGIDDAKVGAATVERLADDLQDPGLPHEINRLGRTLWRWRTPIANWHAARVTNAATEAANNLIKRVKRAAFGFTNFANYRIRALLYAGKPNWALLDTLTPTRNAKRPYNYPGEPSPFLRVMSQPTGKLFCLVTRSQGGSDPCRLELPPCWTTSSTVHDSFDRSAGLRCGCSGSAHGSSDWPAVRRCTSCAASNDRQRPRLEEQSCDGIRRSVVAGEDGSPLSPAALWTHLQGQASIGSTESSPGAVRVVEPVSGKVRRSGAPVSRGDRLFDQVQQFGLAGDAE